MKKFLMGIDIGTSACKVAIFCENGEVAASASSEYPVYYPHPGWAEQNPDEWWAAVCTAIQSALHTGNISSEQITAIGIDGQSWSAIAIDKAGNVLTNTPIWMDTRTQYICDRLNAEIGAESIFHLCGNPLQPTYTTAKILWYKEQMPQIYKHTDKILSSNGFIAYRLTGKISLDISQAYGFHCFDMRKGCWNPEMCNALGISMHLLPEIVPCHQIIGTITKEAASSSGLMEGIPVVAGGLDAACGTLGAGVIHSGETQEQGGQAGGMSICLDTYHADSRLILGYHVIPGKWLLQGGTTGGGGAMRWLEQEFADYERQVYTQSGQSSLQQFNEMAKQIAPGSDGLIFLPYMAGERSPIWDPHAKGLFYGIDFQKTKAHFVRAVMEGVAYSLKHNLDTAEQAGASVNELLAVGGSANSSLWMQIKSDVTGKPLAVPYSDTATTLGAALLAGVGAGVYESFDQAVRDTVRISKRYLPNPENYERYQKNYEIYLSIYTQLKDVMKRN